MRSCNPLAQLFAVFLAAASPFVWGGSESRESFAMAVFAPSGPVAIDGRKSPHSLYWEELATFGADAIYNQRDAEGFINLYGLPIKVQALLQAKAK